MRDGERRYRWRQTDREREIESVCAFDGKERRE